MNETSAVISLETYHEVLSLGELGIKVSNCASQSVSSHLTSSTNLRNETKILEGTEWRRANAEKGERKKWGSYSWGGKPLTLGIKNHKQRKSA